jgi:peptidoglycan/LPS O-acetylase OafA/YrhL
VQAADRSAGGGFRPDLEGLRGVAILLVLVFHARLPGTGGGFVGVDVFLVLSGFLITGLLLRERERLGTIDLRVFYARRARRILPAALAVIVGTLALSALMLAPLDLPGVAVDAAAAALSVGNLRFAVNAMDYFAPPAAPSPLLHYWSLGVEEQFYLVWPALMIVAARGRRPRLGAAAALGVVLLASYAAALFLTDFSAPWAFYSLPTRAWQLALGGLLAVSAEWHDRLPDRVLVPVGWLGLGAILAALVVIDPGTPYPGLAALLPSVGAAAVVLAGSRRGSVGALLVLPPIRFLGRISYSLYLVHWPILVLPAANLAIDEELPLEVRFALALISVVVAAASYRWIEQPFQHGLRLAMPPGRTLALAGATVAATVLVALAVDAGATRSLQEDTSAPVSAAVTNPAAVSDDAGPDPAVEGGTDGTAPPVATADVGAAPTPVATPTPAAMPTPAATPAATSAVDAPSPSGPQPLPADVRPSLAAARDDRDGLGGCTLDYPETRPRDCVFGDAQGATTVALVGDSHAAQWFPPLQRIAGTRGWRLVTFTKVSCRFVDVRQYARVLKRDYTECDAWRERVVQSLESLRPDLVIVAVTRSLKPIEAADNDPRRQGEAMARLLQRIPGRIAILVDTPQSRYDVPSCLSRNLADATRCETSRRAAFGWRHLILERTAAEASGATMVDLSHRICPRDPCPVVLDGMIVYRDSHHLTATFATSLAGDLEAALPDLDPPAPDPSSGAPGIPTATDPR